MSLAYNAYINGMIIIILVKTMVFVKFTDLHILGSIRGCIILGEWDDYKLSSQKNKNKNM